MWKCLPNRRMDRPTLSSTQTSRNASGWPSRRRNGSGSGGRGRTRDTGQKGGFVSAPEIRVVGPTASQPAPAATRQATLDNFPQPPKLLHHDTQPQRCNDGRLIHLQPLSHAGGKDLFRLDGKTAMTA